MKSLKVGLLDADVYGPSIPIMMNLQEQPLVDDETVYILILIFLPGKSTYLNFFFRIK